MIKRIISVLLCVFMLCAVFPVFQVSAADGDRWEYRFTLQVNKKDGAGSKNGYVFGYINFKGTGVDETLNMLINGTGKKGTIKDGEKISVIKTSNYAPWIIKYVGIINKGDDALCVNYIRLEVRKNGSGSWKELLPEYNPKGSVREKWIETQKKSGYDKYFETNPYDKREISSLGNFSSFGGKVTLDVEADYSGKSVKYLERVWNRNVTDQFKGQIGSYDSFAYSDAPKITLSAWGTAQNPYLIVNLDTLEDHGLTVVKYSEKIVGYKIDKTALISYMNKMAINRISINAVLDFPSGGVNTYADSFEALGGNSYGDVSKTLVIERNAFALTDIEYSNVTKSYNADNNYYSLGAGYVEVSARIMTGGNNNHLTKTALYGRSISFDEAKIQVGSQDKYLHAERKSAVIDSTGRFTLKFPLEEGLDSEKVGTYILLSGGSIKINSVEYLLCEEGKDGAALVPGSFTEYKVGGRYMIDTKAPEVVITPVNEAVNGWRKTINIVMVPTEDISYINKYKNIMMYQFARSVTSGGKAIDPYEIYDMNGNNPGTFQFASGDGTSPSDIVIALRKKLEVTGCIIITGYDIAGNPVRTVLENVSLDNKAPYAKISINSNKYDSLEKSRSFISTFDISDASGTGRVYYCFTKGTNPAPKIGSSELVESGVIDNLIGKWAFIEQSDDSVDGVAVLKCAFGDNFNGRFHYYTEDGCGNRSEVKTVDVNIINENTACVITAGDGNVAVPLKNYDISILTDDDNTVYWRWYDPSSRTYVSDYRPFISGTETGSGKQLDNDGKEIVLNGAFVLKVKVVGPSGSYTTEEAGFTFDNRAPELSAVLRTPGTYKDTQIINIKASDASDIASAYARITDPDGNAIDGTDVIALNVSDGTVDHNITVSGIDSGAYTVCVTVTDNNGFETQKKSDVFYIRSEAPVMTAEVEKGKTYETYPLFRSQDYKIKISASETFENAGRGAVPQEFYYRTADAGLQYGAWTYGGTMTAGADGYSLKSNNADGMIINSPVALVDGMNTVYIQAALIPSGTEPESIDAQMIASDELVIYFDEIAPQYRLEIRDIHTNGSITGQLVLSDNLTGVITCVSDSGEITVAPDGDNAYSITVRANTDKNITVADAAGNTALVPIVIKNIDKTAPNAELSAPSVVERGARRDCSATVSVKNKSLDEALFAFIPKGEIETAFENGIIKDEYFIYDTAKFAVSLIKENAGVYENETDCEYKVTVSAVTGEYYLGVYASDSVGNESYTVFDGDGELFSAVDAEIALLSSSVTPNKAGAKAILTANFNVPVAVLPQDKIQSEADGAMTPEEKAEADALGITYADYTNLREIRKYSQSFSEKTTIVIRGLGTYKLYAEDELGRTSVIEIEVTGEDVSFGNSPGITATTYLTSVTEVITMVDIKGVNTTDPSQNYTDGSYDSVPGAPEKTPLAEGKWAAPIQLDRYIDETVSERTVTEGNTVVTFTTTVLKRETVTPTVEIVTDSPTKYLMHRSPSVVNGANGMNEYMPVNGLVFDENASVPYLGDSNQLLGYTKLVYNVIAIEETYIDASGESWLRNADINERELEISYCVVEDLAGWENAVWETTSLLIDNIDNTPAEATAVTTPSIEKDDEGEPLHYTLGNVTSYVNFSDIHSGLQSVSVFTADMSENDFSFYFDFTSPANYIDEDTLKLYEASNEYISVSVYADHDTENSKRMEIVFYKNTDLYFSVINGCGVESGLATDEGLIVNNIYRKDLSGDDYTLAYYYTDGNGSWTALPDGADDVYYKTVKAVITVTASGLERGLYATNNSSSLEKQLDSFDSSFTFRLADKYGYTLDIPVQASNFDIVPGSVGYEFSSTEKTNKDVTVTITASDAQSGVGTVTLTKGTESVVLARSNGEYAGTLTENGNYVITMTDKAGNIIRKSFAVSNINKTKPEIISRDYSFTQEDGKTTSKDISVSLKFSKPGVALTKVEAASAGNQTAFSVDYTNSILRFSGNMSLTVWFADEYGNENSELITVKNIYKTPPAVAAVLATSGDKKTADVAFELAKDAATGAPLDTVRKLSDLNVSYGGNVQRADSGKFTFTENGTYTFKVYDDEGVTSYVTATITGIDKTAPKITQIRWSYEYDLLENGAWTENNTESGSYDTGNEAGYIIATDTER